MIIAAAIRLGAVVLTGRRHNEIISQACDLGYPTPIGGEQGFIDDTGTFLGRHEAGEHAVACGQILAMRWPGMGLDSVEIYPRAIYEEPGKEGAK